MKYANIGKCLKIAQVKKDMTTVSLANLLGVSPQVAGLMRQRPDMKYHQIQDICALFDMTVDDFLGLEDWVEPSNK
ncbi:helix-turn-helix transcriptional regulator [bacterium]|nr:helix-turn-helix transcriptional regulator [bacterium]